MDASIWASCGVLGAFIVYYPLSLLLSAAYPKSVAFLRRHIFNPQIPRKLRLGSIRGRKLSVNIRGTGVVTPLYIIIAAAVLILNVVVLALSLKSRNLLIWRSGRVLAFNLCIMIVSGRQSLFSESLGIAYEFQAFFHRWLGRVIFLVGIIHAVIALVPYQTGGAILSPVPRIAGFTAASALVALILSSFSSVRQTFYEVFRYCHVFFAVIIVVGGFLHLTPIGVSKPSAILFIITAFMYFLLFSMRTGMLILQRAKAAIFHGDGLLKVDIELTRPIRVRAGQHIWLRIPSASHTSFAESHPFAIASWGNTQNGKAKEVTLLIDVRAGFTRKLKMLANLESTNTQRFNAYIDGPYGLSPRAEEYGTVILYATGIGIGAQLATVKHLLESREAGTAKTQRVTLLWEVEEEFMEYDKVTEKYNTKYDTAYQMVLDLLQQDFARLSKLRLEPAKEFEYRSGWQGAPPDQGYMFRCTRYVKKSSQHVVPTKYHDDSTPQNYPMKSMDRRASIQSNWSGSTLLEKNHGNTASLRTIYCDDDLDVAASSLKSQLGNDNCRGRTMVSVCAYPEFADSIRNIVAAKGLHLHEHEFRPEKWPRLEREKETAGNEYPAGNEKTVGYEYRPAEVKPVGYTDQRIAGSEDSTETEKTIGYEYRATKETTIGYRYSAN